MNACVHEQVAKRIANSRFPLHMSFLTCLESNGQEAYETNNDERHPYG
ncbi:hypothetical protein Closa_2046 [[Clostridium] saccharolyticum WM1]|uniref:Uncharacterized protein n=1 Tax=Lacrimispora saccharolytica (strain ATCC 35040 / DSM 2544 / NRCC 2533 / WM1) TaxID=610130 RepID=D9R178_LACSW|nr:hypothetical protein Closa_2046 [[Clostridium] saccharolyticum WM1]